MFELLTPYEKIQRWDRPWAAGTGDLVGHNPLNPNDVRYYRIGEWLEYDDAANFRRGGNNAAGGDETIRMCWPFFMERGRYDMQGIAGGRATVLYGGFYEFVTDVGNYAAIALGGVGTALTVEDVIFDGVVARGLDTIVGAGLIHARVTWIDTVNSRVRAVRIYS